MSAACDGVVLAPSISVETIRSTETFAPWRARWWAMSRPASGALWGLGRHDHDLGGLARTINGIASAAARAAAAAVPGRRTDADHCHAAGQLGQPGAGFRAKSNTERRRSFLTCVASWVWFLILLSLLLAGI